MSQVKIFWDPQGFALDSVGDHQFLGATDGDTPAISVAVRMLCIDTPEVHYPGNQKPSKQDTNLHQLADWIQQGKAPISDGLAQHLHPRLVTGTAGTLQETQGNRATEHFRNLLDEKLKLPNGKNRNLFVWTGDEKFEQYGRLLAYIAPNYSDAERARMSRKERATFNLLMVESGWAASLIIYPSIPSYPDLVLFQETSQAAFTEPRGAWADPLSLTGYEFRMCIKLFQVTQKLVNGPKPSREEREGWVERYCVDMTTREIFFPQDYHRVKPYNRLFIWSKDVTDAVSKLNLTPPE
ncbi:MAG: thermonuclease family protein [Chloroflexi bacterium]|nr:thermonuclease family protein [Chloroflexota bacterium]